MNKFDSLLDEPKPLSTPEECEEQMRYWRKKAALALMAYSDAYWEYEEALVLEDACRTLAAALEAQE